MTVHSRFALLVVIACLLTVPSASRARTTAPEPPHLIFSTYLGGAKADALTDIAVAPDGTIVGVGPLAGNAVVTRLSADGSHVLGTHTIVGAEPLAVAVGADGAIYIAGRTHGGLQTVRPVQAIPHVGTQAFAAKLSADASQLLFCTYLGGSRAGDSADDEANDIEVDDAGLAYVVGTTTASNNDFPLANPTQATFGGGASDGFVAIIDADTATLGFSTYVGDQEDDDIKSCAVDPHTKMFYTRSFSLPSESRVAGVIDCEEARERIHQWIHEGNMGEGTLWITLIYYDMCHFEHYDDSALAYYYPLGDFHDLVEVYGGISPSGNAQRLGGSDVQIAVFDDQLHLLRTASFGGPADEYPKRVVVDHARGILYVIGEADGVGLPTVNPFQATYGGGLSDTFVAAFDLATLQPVFSSYIGGSGFEFPFGIALDAEGNILLAGSTDSANFPTTPNALQPVIGGDSDGWLAEVSKLGDVVPNFTVSVDPPAITATRGQSGTLTVDVVRTGGLEGRVTITTPDTKAIKVKLTPPSTTTVGDSVTIKFKVKKKAQLGTYQLEFRGTDVDGRERSANLSLTIE